jgi:hypothetical protein
MALQCINYQLEREILDRNSFKTVSQVIRENIGTTNTFPLADLEHQFHVLKCVGCELRQKRLQKYTHDLNRYFADTHTNSTTTQVIIACLQHFFG